MVTANKAWLGIDLGTQSVKVVAVSNDGDILARHTEPLASTRDGRLHEQSPERWVEATTQCLRQVTHALSPDIHIAGLSTCATSGTIAIADSQTGSVRPTAVMYDDTRGHEFTARVNDAGRETWSRLGYTMQDSWALPAMLWWNSVEPLTGRDVFITQADVIHWLLGGPGLPSDSSHTLKAGFDLDTLDWPSDVLATVGLDRLLLNDVVPPGSVIGSVTSAASRQTGLPEGTPIIAGMTDGSAAQIAAGAVGPGRWNSVLGTTLVLKGSSPARHTDPSGSIYCHLGPFGSGWWPGGASNTGTLALNNILPTEHLDTFPLTPEIIRDTPVNYPLTGVGERFPFVQRDATGFTVDESGLDPGADSTRLFASVALGVSLVERLAFDVVSQAGYVVDGPISLTGGGSTNVQWNQLRATVMQRSCQVPRNTDGAVGMAILARAGIEAHSAEDFDAIVSSMVTVDSTLTPDLALKNVVDSKYAIFIDQLQARGWIDPMLAHYAKDNHR